MGVIKDLLRSKKAVATMAGIAAWGLGRAGLDVPASELEPVLQLIGWYVVGQGVADVGQAFIKAKSMPDLFGAEPKAGAK
jgi:uncharacterized membrane protein HdeD (DUF308 family)